MYKMHYLFGVEVDKATYDKYADRKYPFMGSKNGIGVEVLRLYATDSSIAKDLPEAHREARRIVDQIKAELTALPKPDNLSRICPMSIASGNPCNCREDCALFVKRSGWHKGCCSIAAISPLLDELNENIDGIIDEVCPDATP